MSPMIIPYPQLLNFLIKDVDVKCLFLIVEARNFSFLYFLSLH